MARKGIPDAVQVSIFLKSRRRCCLCFGLNGQDIVKKGQLAHLDWDNENFTENNLAFLCLEHHDEYDSTLRLSKGLREKEVRQWRNALYRHNASLIVDDAAKEMVRRFSCHAHSIIEALSHVGERSPLLGIHEELSNLATVADELGIPTPIEIETIQHPPGKPNPIMRTELEGNYAIRYPGGSEEWGRAANSNGVELLIENKQSAILSLKQWLIHLKHGIAGRLDGTAHNRQ